MSAALTTNVDQRLLRTTKFPPEFNIKVDTNKVNIQLIKAWVTDEIARIMKSEDDIVTELIFNILDSSRYPNIKELQISLTGFLDKDAAPFCTSLWKLCLSAQDSPHGVPKELVEAKKAELAQAKAEEDKQREEAMKKQDRERERDRELARVRERERNERSDRGRGRGGRYGRGFDRPPRDSRSPPRRRRDDDDYRRPPRGADTYVPSKSRNDDRPPRRRRSPSPDRSSSRTPTPPPRRRRRNTSSEPSRSPPRRRRRYSSDDNRSRSRDRGDRKNGRTRDDDRRRKSRSQDRRRRSPSPRRNHRKSFDRSRSPPTKRNRKASPSPARDSTSHSHTSATSPKSQSPQKKEVNIASNDLMSSKRTQDANRLSRESSQMSASQTETPAESQMRAKANILREQELKAQLLARKVFFRRDSVLE